MRVLALLPAFIVALAIWKFSDTPNLTIAHGTLDTVVRKFAHMIVFGGLAASCCLAIRAQGVPLGRSITGGALVALGYAAIDEYHQTFVPTRHGALSDVAIDFLGIGIASIVLAKVSTRRGVR